MAVNSDRNDASAPLVQAARRSGLSFEASPTGRWIRIAGSRGVTYVVQDVWGEGCLLMEVGQENSRQMRHFLNAELAVSAAAVESGAAPDSWQRVTGSSLAEAS